MAKYFDPNAPATRVVFGGVVFVDNVSEDITAGPATLELFASAGIIELVPGDLPPGKATDADSPTQEKDAAKPASRHK